MLKLIVYGALEYGMLVVISFITEEYVTVTVRWFISFISAKKSALWMDLDEILWLSSVYPFESRF